MGLISVQSQIRSLELQLQILKAKLGKEQQKSPTKSFGELYGLLKGKVESTEEEIDAVLYQL
jgi:hypothetical protein